MRRRFFRAKIGSGKILAVLLSTLSRPQGGFACKARKFSHEFKSFARNA